MILQQGQHSIVLAPTWDLTVVWPVYGQPPFGLHAMNLARVTQDPLTPRLALGVRHDGGGVTLAAPAQGLTLSLEGRGVLTHEAAGFRDRGVAGSRKH